MSFIVGNYDEYGNAFMMSDSIGITSDLSSENTKVAKHYDERYKCNVYVGFSGTIDACETMMQHFVNFDIQYDAPKYKLIKEVNDWLVEFLNDYNICFDMCSLICMFKNRFIVIRICDRETPYDIYVTDPDDVNKNPTAIGAGLDIYYQFTKLFEGTKYNEWITFDEIFKLVTYKNINTNFPVYRFNPSNDSIITYKDFNDRGRVISMSEFKFINI